MINVRDLSMTYRSAYGDHAAVRGVSFDIEQGKFFTFLGPSGCGKTTMLRCVAGLEYPDSGEILVGGEVVYSSTRGIWVPPHQRNIGMVFQSYAIWPHMTVFDNVAFPLRHKQPRPARPEIRERVKSALALVQLSGLEARPAPFLSGGQQQRLALARALASEPRVLLLDEPLSNLDAKLREEMRFELRQIIERLGITTLFVTHEQVEALTMSDVIAVMKDGAIVQQGAPAEIYGKPAAAFVADFIGRTNFLAGQVKTLNPQVPKFAAIIETAIGPVACQLTSGIDSGEAATVAIRPENVTLKAGAADHGPNSFAGTVDSIVYLGNFVECVVRLGVERIRVQVHPSESFACGDAVQVCLPPEHCTAMRR
jgi:iron(III) transport system ATP-binding protein